MDEKYAVGLCACRTLVLYSSSHSLDIRDKQRLPKSKKSDLDFNGTKHRNHLLNIRPHLIIGAAPHVRVRSTHDSLFSVPFGIDNFVRSRDTAKCCSTHNAYNIDINRQISYRLFTCRAEQTSNLGRKMSCATIM